MTSDIIAVLAGVIAAAIYVLCTRSMAGMGGGGKGGGGRSAGGGGRAPMPGNAGAGRTGGAGRSSSTPPAAKPGKATGKPSNWNADGTHGSNWDKGSAPKAGTQGSRGAAGKAGAAGSGRVTTVRGNAHGSQSDEATNVGDVGNTVAPGNANDGNNLAGGNFGDVPVTGTTNVTYDADGNLITDEQPGGQ